MAISGHERAQLTARAGVLRAGTGRAGAVGDQHEIYTVAGTTHIAGEFKHTAGSGHPPEDQSDTFTNLFK